MEYKDFRNKINNEYKRVQIARLAGIGFNVYSHDTEHPRKDLIGYCIPTSEDSFEFFIKTMKSLRKTGCKPLTLPNRLMKIPLNTRESLLRNTRNILKININYTGLSSRTAPPVLY